MARISTSEDKNRGRFFGREVPSEDYGGSITDGVEEVFIWPVEGVGHGAATEVNDG